LLISIASYCKEIAATIERFGGYDQFESDGDYLDSISMKLFQIGELAGSLEDDFKEASSAIVPWDEIRGMRNHFAHGYMTMSESIIWKTATIDIPALLAFCETKIG
jgi:uncharacterized protein with HEPN domain